MQVPTKQELIDDFTHYISMIPAIKCIRNKNTLINHIHKKLDTWYDTIISNHQWGYNTIIAYIDTIVKKYDPNLSVKLERKEDEYALSMLLIYTNSSGSFTHKYVINKGQPRVYQYTTEPDKLAVISDDMNRLNRQILQIYYSYVNDNTEVDLFRLINNM